MSACVHAECVRRACAVRVRAVCVRAVCVRAVCMRAVCVHARILLARGMRAFPRALARAPATGHLAAMALGTRLQCRESRHPLISCTGAPRVATPAGA